MANAAEAILPAEIWELILSHIEEDTNDALSCYQTCSLWKSTLQKSRSTWLFSLIYPYLHKQLKWNIKDVKSCRLVCQSWTKGIDAFMESHRFHPISFPNPSWLTTKRLWSTPDGFVENIPQGYSSCKTFMNDFKGSKRNPFISRTLQLSLLTKANSKNIEILRVFGRHLWSLSLDISKCSFFEAHPTRKKVLECLYDILECVPFLKYFEVSVPFLDPESPDESDDHLEKFVESQKPLKLPHLVLVDLKSSLCPLLKKVLIQIFENPQVTILYEYEYDMVNRFGLQEGTVLLSWNMSELNYHWNTEASYFQSHIEALSRVNLPIESVRIVVKCFPDIDQLFLECLKFKDSLRSLHLTFKKYRTECLALPATSTQNTLSIYAKYFSYISQFQKLKRLEVVLTIPASPTEADLQFLAHSILMEHWSEYREAGEKGRRIEIKTFPNSEVDIIVNLLKKETSHPTDDIYYPLTRKDCDRLFEFVNENRYY